MSKRFVASALRFASNSTYGRFGKKTNRRFSATFLFKDNSPHPVNRTFDSIDGDYESVIQAIVENYPIIKGNVVDKVSVSELVDTKWKFVEEIQIPEV